MECTVVGDTIGIEPHDSRGTQYRAGPEQHRQSNGQLYPGNDAAGCLQFRRKNNPARCPQRHKKGTYSRTQYRVYMTLPSQERSVDALDLLRSADCGINGISEKHQETEGNCGG